MIDNFSNGGDGFDFNFGQSTWLPPLVSDFTASPLSSCTVPLDVTLVNNSSGATSQTWTFGDGTSSTAFSPGTQTYTVTGDYLISLTVTDGSCTSVSSQRINLNTGPVINILKDTTICNGNSVDLIGGITLGTPYNDLLFANTVNSSIPNNDNTGLSDVINSIGVDSTFIGPSTVQAICFTINHTNHADMNNDDAVGISINVNGNTYYYTPLPLTGSGTETYCFPQSVLDAINAAGGPSNTAWTFNIQDQRGGGGGTGSLVNWSVDLRDHNFIDSYIWSPTTNMINSTTLTPTVSPSVTTVYNLTATDGFGCTGTGSVTVTVVAGLPTPVASADQSICVGGSVTDLTVSGGTGTFNWYDDAALTNNIGTGTPFTPTVGLGDNWFYVTETEAGCTSLPDSVLITINVLPTALISPDPAEICAGLVLGMNGTPTGGSGAYTTHAWTNTGSTSLDVTNIVNPNFSNVTVGNYDLTYTVTDDNGCIGTDDITVVVNANPTALISPDPAEICAGLVLGMNGTPTGGSGTYTAHAWTNTGSGSLSATNVVNPDFSNATAGNYDLTYTVTDDNGCIGTDDITVVVNENPTALISPDPAAICAGLVLGMNGTPAGGSGTYSTHVWSNTGSGSLSDPNIVDPNFSNVTAGNYDLTYTVTDDNGCVGTDDITVIVNALPLVNIPAVASICAGVDIILTEDAGDATFWMWSSLNGTATITSSGIQTPTISNGVNNETFQVIGTDANGCVDSTTFTIAINALPVIASDTTTPSACNALDGSIQVTLTSGPTVTGTLSWTGTATNNAAAVLPDDITGLGAGSYNVTFTDVNGCVSNITSEVLNNPGAPIIDAIVDTVSCGVDYQLVMSDITGTNLTSNLTYYLGTLGTGGVIADGTIYTAPTNINIFVRDSNGVCKTELQYNILINVVPTLTFQDTTVCSPGTVDLTDVTFWSTDVGTMSYFEADGTTPVANELLVGAGTYVLSANNAGCITTGNVTVTVNTTPTLTLQDTTVCSPATVNITDVTYWSADIGTLSYFESDGTTPMTTQATAGAGTYVISANNAGCITTGNVTVIVNTTPTLTLQDTTVCSPATVNITDITYWSADIGTLSYFESDGTTPMTTQTTAGAGIYVVSANNTGCITTGNVTVAVVSAPTLTLQDTTVCSPATVNITDVIYWSADIGTLSYFESDGTTPMTTQATAGAGTYVISANNSGCITTGNVTVTVNTTPTLTLQDTTVCSPVTVNITDVIYWSADIGTLSYFESDGTTPMTTQATAGAGTYVISANNAGCITTGNVTVIVNTTPTLTLQDTTVCSPATVNITDVTYWSADIGTLSYFESDGTTPMTTQATAGNGTYVLSADNAGCITALPVVVTVVTTPVIDPLGPITACDSYTLPAIGGTDLSGTEAYYDATGGPTVANVVTGPITVDMNIFIYDGAAGCSDEEPVSITINALPTVTAVSGGDTYCEGDVVSDIIVDVTGSANWSVDYTLDGAIQNATGTASPVNLGNAAGVYVVTDITDANCTNTGAGTQTIIVNAIPLAPLAGTDSEYCSTVPFADMTASGNGGTMTWYSDAGLAVTSVLSTGSTLAPNDGLGATTYYVTETLNGCEGPASEVIITINFCTITIPTAFTPDGDGVNDDWEILDIDQTYPENIVYVYNRWGNLLFTSVQGDYDNNRWDGTFKGADLPVGSYYFIIEHNNEENDKENGVVSIILNKQQK